MPEQEAYFTSQFNTLADKLTELDEKFSEAINKYENKKILVTHAAYGYWERDYGIEQIAITGISPTDEPSQRKLTEILDLIENSSINHVIFEQNIQPRVASVIQDEAGLTSLQFHNLEVLTQIDIDNEDDYFTLMNHNISVLEEALQ
ncbi:Zinc-uptake complex component A, substrate-binding [Amphibacillus marinus]|uniref:Zinc-uptake complex component A, substrate-binding n=1 Tax=Amphibacillus marinus TaxID=872970 RepID=A0A1H8Q187_9BACI|nr:Zinc-uptake complex component A, substrate-binding [Amphibacillus marinus]